MSADEFSYTIGRAVGIHAITRYEGEEFTSGELEIDISGAAPAQSIRTLQPIVGEKRLSAPAARLSFSNADQPPAGVKMADLMSQALDQLQGHSGAAQEAILSTTPQYGTAADQIGTFGGWTFWVGWNVTWPSTYTPDGESYAYVVYFAPEAIYVALQKAEFLYSSPDVFEGVTSFWGGLVSPDGEYLTRSYIDGLNGVTFHISTNTKVIPAGTPPDVVLSKGVTFYRQAGTENLERAVQFSCGLNTNFELMRDSIPFSILLDYAPCVRQPACGVYAGFYPIILWNLDSDVEGNPIREIVSGLEEVAADPGESFVSIIGRQFAEMLLPLMRHVQTTEPVTLCDDVPPESNTEYFGHFLQNHSLAVPGTSPNTSIDYLIGQVKQWLESGPSSQLPEAVENRLYYNPDLYYEYMRSVQAGTQLGFELGYKRGYDAAVAEGRRDDDKIYASCLTKVPCAVGEWCSVVVEATEVAECFPGSQPADFEGAFLRFHTDPLAQLETQDGYAWAEIQNGVAIHEFVMRSNFPMVTGPYLHKDYNPVEAKYVELCRRVVSPAERTFLYSNDKALPGQTVRVKSVALDEMGFPLEATATVEFYDDQEVLIGAPIETASGLASIDFIPEPSVPFIEVFQAIGVGVAEVGAGTAYALLGRGYSRDADVLINGISVDVLAWDWEVISSREIVFRPPESETPLPDDTEAQVINPYSIPSNVVILSEINLPPQVTLDAGPSVAGPAPLSVDFVGSATDVDGHLTSYSWLLDVEVNPVIRYVSAATITSITSFTYLTPGIHQAVFRATDDLGVDRSAAQSIAVWTPRPTSTPSGTPTPTNTSTPTPTVTLTATNTFTPTFPPTDTPMPPPTETPTPTLTGTPTPSETPTATCTPTATGTSTPTLTCTATATYSPTATGTPTSTSTATPLSGDFTGDHRVDGEDLLKMVGGFVTGATDIDLDGDGTDDYKDLFIFSIKWGSMAPE